MQTKLFIGIRAGLISQNEGDFKKVKLEGKEYVGLFANSELPTLKEIEEIAKVITLQEHHVTLFPVTLIG